MLRWRKRWIRFVCAAKTNSAHRTGGVAGTIVQHQHSTCLINLVFYFYFRLFSLPSLSVESRRRGASSIVQRVKKTEKNSVERSTLKALKQSMFGFCVDAIQSAQHHGNLHARVALTRSTIRYNLCATRHPGAIAHHWTELFSLQLEIQMYCAPASATLTMLNRKWWGVF